MDILYKTRTMLAICCLFTQSGWWGYAYAGEDGQVIGTCTMRLNGKLVWNGKCCITASAQLETMLASLHAEGWKACLYNRKHPGNAALPTYRQTCMGPWINISEEYDKDRREFSAYWSIEGACHGDGTVPARQIDANTFRGESFVFEWRRN